MININLICVGRLKEMFYTDAANEYIKRLSGYCKLEVVEIPEHRISPVRRATPLPLKGAVVTNAQVTSALEKERAAIESKIPAGSTTIALCVEGRETGSQELSYFLSDRARHGVSRLCFIIGGSFGLHEGVKERADYSLSLSKMTFPHNLARVILLEQLYRAFNIAEGGKYHK